MPEPIAEKPSSGVEPHWPSASRAEAMKPIDSSSGVVWAFPTTNEPRSSTMNVSVIVPPASIARTRGTWAPFSDIQPPTLTIAVECGIFALGAALIRFSARRSIGPVSEGLLLGVASGVLFGVSDIALKYLTGAVHAGVHPTPK